MSNINNVFQIGDDLLTMFLNNGPSANFSSHEIKEEDSLNREVLSFDPLQSYNEEMLVPTNSEGSYYNPSQQPNFI